MGVLRIHTRRDGRFEVRNGRLAERGPFEKYADAQAALEERKAGRARRQANSAKARRCERAVHFEREPDSLKDTRVEEAMNVLEFFENSARLKLKDWQFCRFMAAEARRQYDGNGVMFWDGRKRTAAREFFSDMKAVRLIRRKVADIRQ